MATTPKPKAKSKPARKPEKPRKLSDEQLAAMLRETWIGTDPWCSFSECSATIRREWLRMARLVRELQAAGKI